MKQLFFCFALLFVFGAQAQQLASNQLYRVTRDFPKYVTAHVEFRDPSGARWPSIFYGKPSSNGVIRVDVNQPSATFSVKCDQRPQKNGDQSRRVLGELFSTTNAGGVILQITGMSAVNAMPEKKGEWAATVAGSLELLGRNIPLNAQARLRPHAGKGDEKNEALMVEMQFDLKAGDLGLKSFDATAPVHVRAALTAYSDAAISAATARRR